MSENNNALGEQIREALSEGLASGDFKDLNDLLSQTVNNALLEAGQQVKNVTDYTFPEGSAEGKARHDRQKEQMKQNWQNWMEQHDSFSASWSTTKGPGRQTINRAVQKTDQNKTGTNPAYQQNALRQSPVKRGPLVQMKRIGNVAGVLYKVFGGIGMGIGGLTLLISLIFLAAPGIMTGAILMLFFFGMIQLGCSKHNRLKRADRYVQLCGSKMYGEIEQLAESTQKSKGYVLRDIRRMLQMGIFPQGHLDSQGTNFMLNDVIYKQYQDAENARRIREQENLALTEKENRPLTPSELMEREQQARTQELNQMIAEGMECIRKLRDMNDAIEGEVISDKLYRLENLLKEIFDKVREYPDQMPQMHKVMDYYLPTTLKLVEAYKEFDQVSVPGEDILSAKVQIENTLDTINAAFTELLNNLFRNRVYDVTTDAQVLETMLAQEGLTKESISKELEYAKTGR